MNVIFCMIGAVIMIALGAVIGFWIEIAMVPPLPNGFTECHHCGPSFVDSYRWWSGQR